MTPTMMSGLYCGPSIPPAEILLAWRLDGIALALTAALVWLGRERPAALWAAGGLGLLYLSPLCALSAALFSARAVHHAALVAGIAPLLALAFPAQSARGLWPALTLSTAVLWAWHLPAAYAFGVVGAAPYWGMQASLLGTAVLFWRAALAAPAGEAGLALLFGALQMGMLGALLTFAARPIYGVHLTTTGPYGLDPLADQQLGGLVMWVPGALPWLVAAAMIAWRGLAPRGAAP